MQEMHVQLWILVTLLLCPLTSITCLSAGKTELQNDGYNCRRSLNNMIRDLRDNWQSPITYLKTRGYIPQNQDHTFNIQFSSNNDVALDGGSKPLLQIKAHDDSYKSSQEEPIQLKAKANSELNASPSNSNNNNNIHSDLNSNLNSNLNSILKSNLNSNTSPNLNTNTSPNLNTDNNPSLNTDNNPSLNTNNSPSLNTNTSPSLNTNNGPSVNTNPNTISSSLITSPNTISSILNSIPSPNPISSSLNTNPSPNPISSLSTSNNPNSITNLNTNTNTPLSLATNLLGNPSANSNLIGNLNSNINTSPDINTELNQPPKLQTSGINNKNGEKRASFINSMKNKFLGFFRGKSDAKNPHKTAYNIDFRNDFEKTLQEDFFPNNKISPVNQFYAEQSDPEIERIIEKGLKKENDYDREFLNTASKSLLSRMRKYS